MGGGGRGSEKVFCLYTHEKVDIFGWPLNEIIDVIFIHILLTNYRIWHSYSMCGVLITCY